MLINNRYTIKINVNKIFKNNKIKIMNFLNLNHGSKFFHFVSIKLLNQHNNMLLNNLIYLL